MAYMPHTATPPSAMHSPEALQAPQCTRLVTKPQLAVVLLCPLGQKTLVNLITWLHCSHSNGCTPAYHLLPAPFISSSFC